MRLPTEVMVAYLRARADNCPIAARELREHTLNLIEQEFNRLDRDFDRMKPPVCAHCHGAHPTYHCPEVRAELMAA